MRTDTDVQSRIEFGIFDWIDDDRGDPADVYDTRLKMVEYADANGFWGYHLAEHHGTPLSLVPSPGLFLSAAARHTRRIRLGSLVHLVPLYNPVRLLQEICMLDHLSRGRLEIGVGRGASPHELEIFNVDAQTSREMFDEALNIMLCGLRTGEVHYEGKHFTFKDVRLHVRPRQTPYPGLWYPTTNVESMPMLAREGYSTVLHYVALEKMKQAFEVYRQTRSEKGDIASGVNGHVSDPKLGFVHHVYVADTDAHALHEAKSAFDAFFYNWSYLGRTRDSEDEAFQRQLDWLGDFEGRMADGWIIAGSPETVRDIVRQQVETTACNYFVGAFAFGTLTEQQIMRSVHLFATHVIPAFR